MVDESTSTDEVAGPIVHVMHVDDSGTGPVRTTLGLFTKDDLSLTIEEDTEELELASERRRRRYRTFNEASLELSSAMAVDMEAMELLGVVDAEGDVNFDTDTRRMLPADDEFLDIAYFGGESPASIDDAQLIHRCRDVEITNTEVDMSETPPVVGMEFMVHGDITLSYDASGEGT